MHRIKLNLILLHMKRKMWCSQLWHCIVLLCTLRRPNPGKGTLHIYCLDEILIYKMVKKGYSVVGKGMR